jgi:hypothetical protein
VVVRTFGRNIVRRYNVADIRHVSSCRLQTENVLKISKLLAKAETGTILDLQGFFSTPFGDSQSKFPPRPVSPANFAAHRTAEAEMRPAKIEPRKQQP